MEKKLSLIKLLSKLKAKLYLVLKQLRQLKQAKLNSQQMKVQDQIMPVFWLKEKQKSIKLQTNRHLKIKLIKKVKILRKKKDFQVFSQIV